MKFAIVSLLLNNLLYMCNSARILAVFPAPFPSHQSVFRPLILELSKRGHDIVVITPDPVFKGNYPPNYNEIDVQNVSYGLRDNTPVKVTGRTGDIYDQVDKFYDLFGKLIEVQTNTSEVQKLFSDKNQHFDLLIIEACVRPALVFSHFFKAPVITISTIGSLEMFTEYMGAISHPTIYPNSLHQRLKYLSVFEKANEIYKHYYIKAMLEDKETNEDILLRKLFGNNVPPLKELKKNFALLMLNTHHIWEDNRPSPPNIVYLGGLHMHINDTNKLSTDLKTYLDSSVHGVIYMSLGSLVIPSRLYYHNLKVVIDALGKLPYDVILKWDQDYLPGCPNNIKILQWVPQREVLGHAKIKLFITQGGLQSTDEAIVAGVPVIGIPILGDQWYNVEKYLDLQIGLRVDLETVNEEKIIKTIRTVIKDNSFKRNIIALRDHLYDRPDNSLDRAVFWVEHVLRNGKTNYLLPATAHISSWEYFEVEFILALSLGSLALLLVAVIVLLMLYKRYYSPSHKLKSN